METVAANDAVTAAVVPKPDTPTDPAADTAIAPGGTSPAGVVISSPPGDEPPDYLKCNDRDYVRQVVVVRKIKELLVSEAVALNEQDHNLVRLGMLNSLRYSRYGKSPPKEAWDELDARLQGLTKYLNDEKGELKRKLQVRLAPGFLYWLPLVMGVVAVFFLCLGIAPPSYSLLPLVGIKVPTEPPPETIEQVWRFVAFVAWLISLGTLGSIAFLYVNVLSIESDKSVDVTSTGFVALRIILGALFAMVIGLPIGYPYFVDFCRTINNVASSPLTTPVATTGSTIEWSNGIALLLPFLLGFSTALVLNVLNRCVGAVQTVFGAQPNGSA